MIYSFTIRLRYLLMLGIALLFCQVFFVSAAHAATITWDGGGADNNWSTCDNWDTDVCPGDTDVATFDTTSVSDSVVDAGFSGVVDGINIQSGYTGTITMTADLEVEVADFIQAGGTFAMGSTTLTLDSAEFIKTGGTFNEDTGTVVFAGTLNVDFDVDGSEELYNVVVNKSASASWYHNIAAGDTMVVLGDLTLTEGYFRGGTIEVHGNITQSADVNASSNVSDLHFANDSVAQTYTINGGTGLALVFDSVADANDSVVLNTDAGLAGLAITSGFSGVVPMNYNGNTFTIGSEDFLQEDGTFIAPDTLILNSADFTKTGGIFDEGTGLVRVAGNAFTTTDVDTTETFYNLEIAGQFSSSRKSIASGDTLVVANDLILTSAYLDGGTVNVEGDITQDASFGSIIGDTVLNFANDSASQTYTVNGGFGPVLVLDSAADANDSVVITGTSTLNGIRLESGFSGTAPFTVTPGARLSFGSSDFIQDAGTFNAPDQFRSSNGDFILNGGTFVPGDTFIFEGSSFTTWDVPGSLALNNVVMNKQFSSSRVTIASGDTMIVNGDLTITQGNFAGGTIEANGNVTQAFDSGASSGNTVLDLANDSVAQTYTINGGFGPVLVFNSVADASDSIIVAGTTTQNGIRLTSTFAGTAPITVNPGVRYGFGSNDYIQDAGTFVAPAHFRSINGDFTINGGTFDALTNDSRFDFEGSSFVTIDVPGTVTFNDLNIAKQFTSSRVDIASGDTVVVAGDLGLVSGDLRIGTVEVQGDVTADASFSQLQSPLVFTGSSSQQIDFTGNENAHENDLTVSKTGGEVVLLSDLSMLDDDQDITLNSGILNGGNGGYTISLGGNWTNNGGTFDGGNGTVDLGEDSNSISGNTTFNNLTKTVSTAQTFTFGASSTQTVLGDLTLEGTSGNLLSLRSDSLGNQWFIDPQATRTVTFLDVQDSNNINATLIDAAGTASVDAGNNVGWDFTGAPNTQPVITLLGSSTVEVVVNATFTDPGATASDNEDGDITASIVVGGDTVDTATVGTYVITYNVTDSAGLAAVEVTRTVDVVEENLPPVFNPITDKTVNEGNTLFIGVSATDPNPGDSGTIEVVNLPNGATFNGSGFGWNFFWTPTSTQSGIYEVEFVATDDGTPQLSTSTFVTITVVNVNELPEITLLGDNPFEVAEGGTFVDPGATALDSEDGDITASIVVGGDTVDTNTPGTYVITYNVTDSEGGAAPQVTRTVTVTDLNMAPVLDAIGDKVIDEDQLLTFAVTASDADAGDTLSFAASNLPLGATFVASTTATNTYVFSWTPTSTQAGFYPNVVFSVTDDGTPQASTSEVIAITVNDVAVNTAPTLTLVGSSTLTIIEGGVFSDPGATANDNEDGDISANIVVGGDTVDPNTVGTYVITYNVTDSGGLSAPEVTRTVEVVEDTSGDAPFCSALPAQVQYASTTAPATCTFTNGAQQLQLLDSSCNAIEDAKVQIRKSNGGFIQQVNTDANGIADFTGYTGGLADTFRVHFNGATYNTNAGSFATGDGVQTNPVSFEFIGSSCTPIEGAKIQLRKTNGGFVKQANTDVNGNVSFELLPGAQSIMRAHYNGGTWDSNAIGFNTEVTLGAENFRLAFSDSMTAAIEGAKVQLRKDNGGFVTQANTDATGLVGFDVLPDALLKFRVHYNGGTLDTISSTEHDLEEVQTETFGLTFNDSTGSPTPGAKVQLRKDNGGFVTQANTDVNGQVAFEVLDEAPLKFRVHYNGGTLDTTTSTTHAPETVQTEEFQLTFIDSNSNAIQGAKIQLRKSNGGFVAQQFTATSGAVVFEVLDEAPLRFRVHYNGGTLDTDVSTDHAPEMVQTETFTASVIDSGSNPLAGVKVQLRKDNGGFVTQQNTATSGTATFEVLDEAPLKFRVHYNGGTFDTVTSTNHNTETIQTQPIDVNITAGGTPLDTQKVQLRKSNSGFVTQDFTDVNGDVSFEVLPNVDHILRSTYNGVTWNSPLTQGGSSISHDF